MAPLSAQAAYYVFDAEATGDFNGPFTGEVHGSFKIDLSKVFFENTWMAADGSQVFSQAQSGEDFKPRGLVNWTLYGASGGSGFDGSIVRTLRPDGSSELTISASDVSTRGQLYSNAFKITYFSSTDVLFTDRSADLSSVLLADRASGTYDFEHSYYSDAVGHGIHRKRNLSFNVTATAVPEPEAMGLALAGLAVLPWLKARGRRAAQGQG